MFTGQRYGKGIRKANKTRKKAEKSDCGTIYRVNGRNRKYWIPIEPMGIVLLPRLSEADSYDKRRRQEPFGHKVMR